VQPKAKRQSKQPSRASPPLSEPDFADPPFIRPSDMDWSAWGNNYEKKHDPDHVCHPWVDHRLPSRYVSWIVNEYGQMFWAPSQVRGPLRRG
jgi:hypothetical protein